MIGAADRDIRLAAFDWLTQLRSQHGDVLPRSTLMRGFDYLGRRVGLMSPQQGIWKPATCELPLSIATTLSGQYPDSHDRVTGRISYSYRGTDPRHRDNAGLRQAMLDRIPLVYLYAIVPGQYVATYPAFVVGDDPARLSFTVQVDDISTLSGIAEVTGRVMAEASSEPRRAYITATVQRRLHQVAFRQRVLHAYREMCALCRLRHLELLDAAHITPDADPEGEPHVSNGLALCKLHHAAFDSFFFTVTPEYRVEVRPSILAESDGPMLIVGLQQIHGQPIQLPGQTAQRPEQARLERRYELFRQAS
jgi:putative restriction endonuclease